MADDHEAHNEFVTKTLHELGPGLIDLGNTANQLVAVESLFAGMVALVAKANGLRLAEAEAFMLIVHHASQNRLRDLINDVQSPG